MCPTDRWNVTPLLTPYGNDRYMDVATYDWADTIQIFQRVYTRQTERPCAHNRVGDKNSAANPDRGRVIRRGSARGYGRGGSPPHRSPRILISQMIQNWSDRPRGYPLFMLTVGNWIASHFHNVWSINIENSRNARSKRRSKIFKPRRQWRPSI